MTQCKVRVTTLYGHGRGPMPGARLAHRTIDAARAHRSRSATTAITDFRIAAFRRI